MGIDTADLRRLLTRIRSASTEAEALAARDKAYELGAEGLRELQELGATAEQKRQYETGLKAEMTDAWRSRKTS